MENNNFYEALKHYFNTTPKDKVLEDWDKSSEYDKIGVTVEEFLDNTNQKETLEEVKDLNFWRNNCEENYITTPISVLRYISELERKQERMYSEEDMIRFAEFVATHPDKNRNVYGEMLHSKSKYDGSERTIDLLELFKKN